MSNTYVNKVIFGNSKEQVDEEYIQSLMPLMLTDERMKRFQSNVEGNYSHLQPQTQHQSEPQSEPQSSGLEPAANIEKKEIVLDRLDKRSRFHSNRNSLFWSIYEIEHPEESFLGTRANAEIDHRLKVVNSLKSAPKRLKETNSKLTIEQSQSLLGSMLTTKEDKLDFCIAYSVFYNKPIMVVYEKTYCVFSPMVDIDLEDENVILLYASKPDTSKQVIYAAEKSSSSKELIANILRTKVMSPLKSMSSYKTQELDDIATILRIPTKQVEVDAKNRQKEKRRKKEDIYNDIKVEMHKDMNFISENKWNELIKS